MVKYFSERFKEKSEVIPNFPGVPFRSLSEEDAQVLTAHFLIEELDVVVTQSYESKSLGPDEFNF